MCEGGVRICNTEGSQRQKMTYGKRQRLTEGALGRCQAKHQQQRGTGPIKQIKSQKLKGGVGVCTMTPSAQHCEKIWSATHDDIKLYNTSMIKDNSR